MEVSIQLPAWPPTEDPDTCYPDLSGWQLFFCGKSGDETIFIPYGPSGTPEIKRKVSKADLISILARPVTLSKDESFETLFFMPCGAVFPADCEKRDQKDQIFLTWEKGFTASLISAIYSTAEKPEDRENYGNFMLKFNWIRFSEEIKNKSDDSSFYNPWFLDFPVTANSISSGKFTVLKIKSPDYDQFPPAEEGFCALSPYIPENEKIYASRTLPVYKKTDNYFFLPQDKLLIINSGNGKNFSETTVFMPKRMNRDSLCENYSYMPFY